jgi:mono/diheme cytochrome c family protein
MIFTRGLPLVVAIALGGCGTGDEPGTSLYQDAPAAAVTADIDQGRELYAKNCSNCHGLMMNGSLQGPPLNHKIYEPSHHGDQAFYRAVSEGTRAHHWNFGDMPAQPQVTAAEVAHIIAYVRDRQRKSGIH